MGTRSARLTRGRSLIRLIYSIDQPAGQLETAAKTNSADLQLLTDSALASASLIHSRKLERHLRSTDQPPPRILAQRALSALVG